MKWNKFFSNGDTNLHTIFFCNRPDHSKNDLQNIGVDTLLVPSSVILTEL